jgi:DNA repair exonuclease SbcCD nuclease subunit
LKQNARPTMKFLHSADWQIGMKARHAGRAADVVREARLESARRVIEVARERGAAFVVLAGDTFEDNAVDRVLVQRVVDELSRSPVPVYVLPGNHDPLVPGSVFDHPAWATARGVTVLRDAAPLALPGGATLLPCPLREKTGAKDPTEAIPPPDAAAPGDGGVRIGVAHGTLQGVGVDSENEFPIPLDAALRRGVDYLALGHWHSTFTPSGGARVAYSGSHETTKFGERDSGNALLVEIDARGAPPRVERVRTGKLAWVEKRKELLGAADVAALLAEVEAIASPERTLVHVVLRGALGADAVAESLRLDEILAARFLHGRVDRDGLALAPGDAAWIESLPPGPVQGAARRLAAAAEGDVVAREALVRLFSLSRAAGAGST